VASRSRVTAIADPRRRSSPPTWSGSGVCGARLDVAARYDACIIEGHVVWEVLLTDHFLEWWQQLDVKQQNGASCRTCGPVSA
jgi:hypothetical protein